MEKSVEWPRIEQAGFNREQRLYDDTTTWLSEVLPGMMRTPFEYTFDGQELYARDGRPLEPIFDDAIETARAFGPDQAYELRRRLIEKEEYGLMIRMARGQLPNSMVVVSDFPPELMDIRADTNGYNAARKQTMLRVITRQADGRILMRSQSLDLSDRASLEAMYLSLGFEPEPGELLGQRMQLDLAEADQRFLLEQLTGVYDRALSARYGGEYFAGRKGANTLNTYDFVRSQKDLIDAFVADSEHGLNERLLYDLAAAVQARFERNGDQLSVSELTGIFTGDPRQEMTVAGQIAAANGKVFSGCGVSLGARGEQELSAQSELGELGYGNKSEETYKLPSRIRCVNCKEKVPTKEVVKAKSWCCPRCKYEVDICNGKVICAGKK